MTSTAVSEPCNDQEPRNLRRSATDVWVCLAVAVGGVFWASVARPLRDPDIWWHVRTGQLILDSGIPHREPWAFTALGRKWVPTAWLSDVVLALLQDGFGWVGIVGFKLVLSGLLLSYLGLTVFRAAPGPFALAVFTACVLVLTPFMAERPQLISLILTTWLARQILLVLEGSQLSWWFIPVTYLWANLHGMWILAPMSAGVITLGVLADRPAAWRRHLPRGAAICAGSLAAAALTPVGPSLAYWSLIVRNAAVNITEWQPTTIADKEGWVYLSVFLLWALAVARYKDRVPMAETVWMFAMLYLGLQAGRNMAPTVILMAPVTARALGRTYPQVLESLPRWRIPLSVPAFLVMAACALAGTVYVQHGAVAGGRPFEIVTELEARPGIVRVMNDYNIGGFLTGQGAPSVSVAIDGRTDNYAPEFIHRYLLATTNLVDLRKLIDELRPDVAVTVTDGLLAERLSEFGWRVTLEDEGYSLLEPATKLN